MNCFYTRKPVNLQEKRWQNFDHALYHAGVDEIGEIQNDGPPLDLKMVYLAAMWAYYMDARVSEYTGPERGGEDHCVRASDLDFELVSGERKKGGQTLPKPECSLIASLGGYNVSWLTRYNRHNTPRFQL